MKPTPRRSMSKKRENKSSISEKGNQSEIKQELRQMIRRAIYAKEEIGREPRDGYLYLYDAFLKGKQYKAILSNIESRLNDFEISGKTIWLSNFTNPRILIEDEMRHGLKTVVIVGNDETFTRILGKAADLEATFGFLPTGQKKNYLAKILGLPLNENACNVIAARKIEKIDFAVLNKNRFFLSYLYLLTTRLKIECDNNFVIDSGKERFEVAVSNLLPPPFSGEHFILHPQDGQMELYLRPQQRSLVSALFKDKTRVKSSIFLFRRLKLSANKPMAVLSDGKESQEMAVEIEVAKKKLKIIVGKNRQF